MYNNPIVRYIFLFITLIGTNSHGQTIESKFGAFPQESIYIHYTSSFSLTGEYIYYSVYCLDKQGMTFSNLSKIAYVELIDDEGKTIFKHKVRLDKGRGQGDFFIPPNTASSSCKLYGYTQFMLNGSLSDFFQGDLVILNPYTNQQNKFIEKKGLNKSKNQIYSLGDDGNQIILSLNKQKFSKREKVELELSMLSKIPKAFSFSLSVRRKDGLDSPPIPTTKNHAIANSSINLRDYSLLPELRGELISGRLLSNETSEAIPNETMVVSIPGQNYFFTTSKTDENGVFFINLADYDGEEIFFNSLTNDNEFKIVLNTHKKLKTEDTLFYNFYLDRKMKKEIVERSVRNQIENNYFLYKPDSVRLKSDKIPFYGNNGKHYILDEYTRFNTFRETIIEILKDVTIKRSGGATFIEVSNDNQSGFSPLILVNGLYTDNYEKLLEFDARKIKKVNVLPNKFVHGTQVYQGILDITTFDNEYDEFLEFKQPNRFSLFTPQSKKHYFKQVYDEESNSNNRLPDFRTQLTWMPGVSMNSASNIIDFFTSDVGGEYEISIEGFSNDLKPISIKKVFFVENIINK